MPLTCSTIQTINNANCARISGIPGPEDFEPEPGPKPAKLFVSSQDRRSLSPSGEFDKPGAIFLVPLDGGAPERLSLTERDALPFHPHGLAVALRTPFPVLYVINHPVHHSHVIELFEIRGKELRFIRRLRSPLLVSPNDLIALSDGHIYVTNDHGTPGGIARTLEDLFAQQKSNVVHFDGVQWRHAASNISFANGIAASPDSRRIFVASSRDRGLFVFNRSTDGQLTYHAFAQLDIGADNLLWEKPGILNLAGHPSALAFLSHVRNPENISPSEVLRINAETLQAVKVFSDPGTLISASSTAQVIGGRLIISQVFEDFLLSCPAPPDP